MDIDHEVPWPVGSSNAPARLDILMLLDVHDDETRHLLQRYLRRLDLPQDALRVTTNRATFAAWLGRRVRSSIGGAYVYLPHLREHAILINLDRIDRRKLRALEVVVAEELVHMRDRLDGDLRRHARHGHDRIAHRLVTLTGVPLDDIRSCLLPVQRRPVRYLYACPNCRWQIWRRQRGTWSCGRCAPRFDRRYRLQLMYDHEHDAALEGVANES